MLGLIQVNRWDPTGLSFISKIFREALERLGRDALERAGKRTVKELSQSTQKKLYRDAAAEAMQKILGKAVEDYWQVHHLIGQQLRNHELLKHLGFSMHYPKNLMPLPVTELARKEMNELLLKEGGEAAADVALHTGRHLDDYVRRIVQPKLDDTWRLFQKGEINEAQAWEVLEKMQVELEKGLTSGKIYLQKTDREKLLSGSLLVGGIFPIGCNEQTIKENYLKSEVGRLKQAEIDNSDVDDTVLRYLLAQHYTGNEGAAGWAGWTADMFNPVDDVKFFKDMGIVYIGIIVNSKQALDDELIRELRKEDEWDREGYEPDEFDVADSVLLNLFYPDRRTSR